MRLAHVPRAQNFHASNKFDPEMFSCNPPAGGATGSFHSRYPLACPEFKSLSNQIKNSQKGVHYLEGPVRLELTTPCLKGRCSNQLSYGPKVVKGASKSIKNSDHGIFS